MSKRRTKHSLDERLEAVQQVLKGKQPVSAIAQVFQVSQNALNEWVREYRSKGKEGLEESNTWKVYSEQLKQLAVTDYLSGQYSLQECCVRYDISSTSVLMRWVKQYTKGKDIKSIRKGRVKMTQRRKTTHQERIEIAQHCLAENKNYQKITDLYHVSYQQVYQWVRKYQENGAEALVDWRGHTLESKPALTKTDQLELRIKELERRNTYLEAENGLIKKLKEIERRGLIP